MPNREASFGPMRTDPVTPCSSAGHTGIEWRIKEKLNYRFLTVEFEPEFVPCVSGLQHLRTMEIVETWDYNRPLAWLRRVCDFMISRLGSDASLDEIANIVGLSSGHFSFAFKRSMGVASHAWLRQPGSHLDCIHRRLFQPKCIRRSIQEGDRLYTNGMEATSLVVIWSAGSVNNLCKADFRDGVAGGRERVRTSPSLPFEERPERGHGLAVGLRQRKVQEGTEPRSFPSGKLTGF